MASDSLPDDVRPPLRKFERVIALQVLFVTNNSPCVYGASFIRSVDSFSDHMHHRGTKLNANIERSESTAAKMSPLQAVSPFGVSLVFFRNAKPLATPPSPTP